MDSENPKKNILGQEVVEAIEVVNITSNQTHKISG